MGKQNQLVRKQHIVARWHLEKFADHAGWLWCYKRNIPAKRSRAKNECWERDFYECDVNGKRTENSYERWLKRIEDRAAPLHGRLLNRQQLSHQDSIAWAVYVASLFLRTKKVRAQFSARMVKRFRERTSSKDYICDLQYTLLKEGELVAVENLRKQVEELRAKMDGSTSFYHLMVLPPHTASLAKVLLAKKWHVLDAGPEKFFVMSDCPVTTFEIVSGHVRAGSGFGRDGSSVFLPMTPMHVFVASPESIRWQQVGSPIAVDSMNLLTVRFAHQRVFSHVRSPDIQALVDSEINRIIFGKDAFVPANRD